LQDSEVSVTKLITMITKPFVSQEEEPETPETPEEGEGEKEEETPEV